MKPTINIYDFFINKFLERSFDEFFPLYDVTVLEARGESLSTARALIVKTFVKKVGLKEKDVKIKLKVKSARVYDLFLKKKDKEYRLEIDCNKRKVKVLN